MRLSDFKLQQKLPYKKDFKKKRKTLLHLFDPRNLEASFKDDNLENTFSVN